VIVLDTDHVNALQSGGSAASTLVANMDRSVDQDFATTAITVEEQMRGWIALIHRLTGRSSTGTRVRPTHRVVHILRSLEGPPVRRTSR
jgi:hypothetical protein